MLHKEFDFESHHTNFFGQYWQAPTTQAVILLVHGMGSHSSRYKDYVVPKLVEHNISVIAYDQFGHGKTKGKRGHNPGYSTLLDCISIVAKKAQNIFGDVPTFLYGHSMGGNLILNYVLRRDDKIAGIIATSPYLRLAFQPPKWKMVLGKLMLKTIPSITLPSGLDANGISRIPEEVEKYKNDSHIHDKVSPMFSFPIMDAGEWAIQNANQLTINTLLLHGTADPIIDPNGTKNFHQNANKTTLQLFEGGYHELHNDLCKDEMFSTIQNWIKQQLV